MTIFSDSAGVTNGVYSVSDKAMRELVEVFTRPTLSPLGRVEVYMFQVFIVRGRPHFQLASSSLRQYDRRGLANAWIWPSFKRRVSSCA